MAIFRGVMSSMFARELGDGPLNSLKKYVTEQPSDPVTMTRIGGLRRTSWGQASYTWMLDGW